MHLAFLSEGGGWGCQRGVSSRRICCQLVEYFESVFRLLLVYPPNTELFLLYISQINFAKEQFKDNKKEWVLLVCIGASSGVGRLTFGKIGDVIPGLKKIYMQVRDPTAAPFSPPPIVLQFQCDSLPVIVSNSVVVEVTGFLDHRNRVGMRNT